MTFFGIDTCLVIFPDACLLFLCKNCRLAFFPRLCHFVFFFYAFLVLLSVSGFLKSSKNLNFSSKFGRHSFSVNLFISKVIVSYHELHFCFHARNSQRLIFARDSRQQYPFMHKCNSTLNTLSSVANQTASLPLALRFYEKPIAINCFNIHSSISREFKN